VTFFALISKDPFSGAIQSPIQALNKSNPA
jgi:hypothetical protein